MVVRLPVYLMVFFSETAISPPSPRSLVFSSNSGADASLVVICVFREFLLIGKPLTILQRLFGSISGNSLFLSSYACVEVIGDSVLSTPKRHFLVQTMWFDVPGIEIHQRVPDNERDNK
jgi:hypothetical protein